MLQVYIHTHITYCIIELNRIFVNHGHASSYDSAMLIESTSNKTFVLIRWIFHRQYLNWYRSVTGQFFWTDCRLLETSAWQWLSSCGCHGDLFHPFATRDSHRSGAFLGGTCSMMSTDVDWDSMCWCVAYWGVSVVHPKKDWGCWGSGKAFFCFRNRQRYSGVWWMMTGIARRVFTSERPIKHCDIKRPRSNSGKSLKLSWTSRKPKLKTS